MRRRIAWAIGIGLLAVGAGALVFLVRQGGDRRGPTQVRAASDAAPAPAHESPAREIARVVAENVEKAEASEAAKPDAITEEQARAFFEKLEKENPTEHDDSGAYSISRATKSGRVVVNLAPGSRVSMPMDTEAAPVGPRTLRGTVRTRKRAPVGGAIVLAGDKFHEHVFPSLDGQAATTTAADGTYVLPGLSDTEFYLLALHPEAGWSVPVRVETGTESRKIDLVIPSPGKVTGIVKRGGVPVAGSVTLASEDELLVRSARCDKEGRYELAPIPPGRYTLSARATNSPFQGTAKGVKASLPVREGEMVKKDVDLPTGIHVKVGAATGTRSASTVTYYFARGELKGTTEEELRAAMKEAGDRGYGSVLRGGMHASQPMSYHDVEPGSFTACVAVQFAGDPRDKKTVACLPIRVNPSPVEQSFEVPVR